MTFEEFDKLLNRIHEEEIAIGKTKGKEYTQGDRLDNFKRLAQELNISPEKVLWVYLKKHMDSISNWVKAGETLSEPIESRILDARVYLALLWGLVEEKN